MLAISAGSRDHMFGPQSIHGELEAMLRPLQRGTLQYVGMEVLPPYVAWHVPYVDDAARRQKLAGFQDHLARIDELTPLACPSLDDYDTLMRPRS